MDIIRKIRNLVSSLRSIPDPILLPRPLSWFQQKLWRIYIVEWTILTFIVGMMTGAVYESDALTVSIAGGFIMVFLGNRLVKLTLDICMKLRKWTKIPIFVWVADILDYIFFLLIGMNYALISRFSAEKLSPTPLERLSERGKWKPK